MIRQLYTYTSPLTDPYRNLALERWFTETVGEESCLLYLWQNENTVVIGRNQNAWRECRTGLLEQEGGKLARRLSGGGAVFHDLGNLNFTFCAAEANYDLRRQQRVILEACRALGIPAELSGRNDLLSEGRKFSGNSFYSHNGKAFHNGTLLIDADMAKMGRYLSPSPAKLAGKGVKSVSSRVINLKELCPTLTVETMAEAMRRTFGQVYGLAVQPISGEMLDEAAIEAYAAAFRDRRWLYGADLPFDFACTDRFSWGEVRLEVQVTQGVCRRVAVYSDAMDADFPHRLETALTGCGFSTAALCGSIQSAPLEADVASDLCALIRAQNI